MLVEHPIQALAEAVVAVVQTGLAKMHRHLEVVLEASVTLLTFLALANIMAVVAVVVITQVMVERVDSVEAVLVEVIQYQVLMAPQTQVAAVADRVMLELGMLEQVVLELLLSVITLAYPRLTSRLRKQI